MKYYVYKYELFDLLEFPHAHNISIALLYVKLSYTAILLLTMYNKYIYIWYIIMIEHH